MARYIVRRLLLAVVVVFGVTLITFVLARVVPQNVAQVWAGFQGFRAGEEAIRAVEEQYHLNEPLHVQYGYLPARPRDAELGHLADYQGARSPMTSGRSCLTRSSCRRRRW